MPFDAAVGGPPLPRGGAREDGAQEPPEHCGGGGRCRGLVEARVQVERDRHHAALCGGEPRPGWGQVPGVRVKPHQAGKLIQASLGVRHRLVFGEFDPVAGEGLDDTSVVRRIDCLRIGGEQGCK